MGGGDIGYGVNAVLYIGPEAPGVLGLGKKAAYAHYGDGSLGVFVFSAHCILVGAAGAGGFAPYGV